jgi:hypothetical protein
MGKKKEPKGTHLAVGGKMEKSERNRNEEAKINKLLCAVR